MINVFINNITQIIGLILFLVFLFILSREFILWYFKINRHIENQNRTVFLLERILEKSNKNIAVEKILKTKEVPKPETTSEKRCIQCNKIINSNFPIIITENGKNKYFCSDDCRLNNLEI